MLAGELGESISRYTPNLNPFEGRLVTGIDVVGFKKTRESVIRREIRAKVGEPLHLSVVDRDVVRLNNLAIFAQVRVDVREDNEGLRLEYQVKEIPPVIPYPAFAFTEENGISIGAGVSAANVRGRDIALSGRALFGGTNNYNLLVNWPWITGNHFEFGFLGAHIERPDEVRGFDEDSDEILPWVGTYFAGDRGRFKVGPAFFRMRSDVPGITLSEDNEDHLYRLGFALGWDTRDSWNVPHHGWLNELQVFRTGGFLGGDGDFWTVDVDVRRFEPVGDQRTLVLASLLTLQSGEAFVDVPSYMRYHLGGANTIRGYSVEDSKELSGKNQYLGTVELRQTLLKPRRYDIFKWSFKFGLELAALADIGIAWDTSNQFAANRLRGGIGLGLRLLTPGTGQTRFDFAWSPEGGFQFHFGGGSKMARSRLRLR
jgi:outer membrane protein insertion porin family